MNRRLRLVTDLFRFAFSGKRLWLLPMALIMLIVSLLAAAGALAPYSAFLYPL